jgi:SEC-C motif-containing protein
MITSASQCPCGSQQPYGQCCGPLISNQRHAETAEQLMRSRYSAHVVARQEPRAIDYLMNTWAAEQRQQIDRAAVEDWAVNSQWLGLNVISHTPAGDRATVEFAVSYRSADGSPHIHRELSQFCRDKQGRWYFVDGEDPEGKSPEGKAPGRNSPCPCGSGKKYKRCCGA